MEGGGQSPRWGVGSIMPGHLWAPPSGPHLEAPGGPSLGHEGRGSHAFVAVPLEPGTVSVLEEFTQVKSQRFPPPREN